MNKRGDPMKLETVVLKLVKDLKNLPLDHNKVMLEGITSSEAFQDLLQSCGSNTHELEVGLNALVQKPKSRSRNSNVGVQTQKVTDFLDNVLTKTEDFAKSVNQESNLDMFLYHTINELNDKHSNEDIGFLLKLEASGFQFDKYLQEFKKKYKTSSQEIIKELCVNFNELASQGKIDPVIGREDEVLRTIEILSKRKKNNAVLLGKAGVGKTAIAEAIALAIVEDKVPKQLKNAVVYNLEMANMVAGTSFRGQFEEKMINLLKEFEELENSGKMPILFIDEIHTIAGSGAANGGALDFANIIKPALSRGKLRCIGATTDAEWNKFINQDKALKRRFSQINVEEPNRLQTIDILKGAKKYYEEKHKVAYTDQAITKCVDLSIEFMNDSALPDKALDLMDVAGAIYKLKNTEIVDTPEMENALSRLKNISLDMIRAKRHDQSPKPIEPEIKKALFGQDEAVKAVVQVVEKSLAGLQDEDKPVGSFLFVGPTGVGKTELAKLLAKQMNAHLERIDMSEFMEPHSVSKFIGAPPGYIGYDTKGRLAVLEKHPHCVLLLDEIEKAHPKVLDILLQAMDNAKVTDSQGDVLNFKNAVIIMTSNAGAREASETKVGLMSQTTSAKIDPKAIANVFSPEFRNRLNGVVYFNSLSKDLMVNIVAKYVQKLQNTRLNPKGIKLVVSEAAQNYIVDKTYDPLMGGRPIERGVQTMIADPLVKEILYGEIKNGKKNVSVDLKDGELTFSYSE